MRPDAFAEINIADNFPRSQIDDDQVAAIGARLSHAGVSVDGNVGEFSVGRSRDFVSGNTALGTSAICFPATGSMMPRLFVPLFATSNSAVLVRCLADDREARIATADTARRGRRCMSRISKAPFLRASENLTRSHSFGDQLPGFEAMIISYGFRRVDVRRSGQTGKPLQTLLGRACGSVSEVADKIPSSKLVIKSHLPKSKRRQSAECFPCRQPDSED